MALIVNGCSDSSRTYTYLSPRLSASQTSGDYSCTPPRSSSFTSQRCSPSVRTPVPTPTSPLTLPAPSVDDIVTRILEHSIGEESQRMRIPGVDEAMYNQIKSRTDARSERLRYYYDCNACSIVIDTLASDIHESIQEYLTESLKFSLRRWVTGIIANANVTIMGAVDRDLVSSDGTKLKGKTPDQGFQVKIPGVEVRDYPNIAVEVGYSESHPDLVDDACHWLTQTHDEPVLAVLIFCFKKPSQDSDFADFKKWKAFIEVYERDPECNTLPKLFSGPVYFIPIQPQPPKFRLALRHLLPPEQIPEGVDPNITASFSVDCNEREFNDAIVIMNRKKRRHDNSTGNVTQGKVKRARDASSRQGDGRA